MGTVRWRQGAQCVEFSRLLKSSSICCKIFKVSRTISGRCVWKSQKHQLPVILWNLKLLLIKSFSIDLIYESVLIRENMGQRKPVFSHILCGGYDNNENIIDHLQNYNTVKCILSTWTIFKNNAWKELSPSLETNILKMVPQNILIISQNIYNLQKVSLVNKHVPMA